MPEKHCQKSSGNEKGTEMDWFFHCLAAEGQQSQTDQRAGYKGKREGKKGIWPAK